MSEIDLYIQIRNDHVALGRAHDMHYSDESFSFDFHDVSDGKRNAGMLQRDLLGSSLFDCAKYYRDEHGKPMAIVSYVFSFSREAAVQFYYRHQVQFGVDILPRLFEPSATSVLWLPPRPIYRGTRYDQLIDAVHLQLKG